MQTSYLTSFFKFLIKYKDNTLILSSIIMRWFWGSTKWVSRSQTSWHYKVSGQKKKRGCLLLQKYSFNRSHSVTIKLQQLKLQTFQQLLQIGNTKEIFFSFREEVEYKGRKKAMGEGRIRKWLQVKEFMLQLVPTKMQYIPQQ